MLQLAQGLRLQVRAETSTKHGTVSSGRVLLQNCKQWVTTDLRCLLVEDCSDPDHVVTAYVYACPVGPVTQFSSCFYKHAVVSDSAA